MNTEETNINTLGLGSFSTRIFFFADVSLLDADPEEKLDAYAAPTAPAEAAFDDDDDDDEEEVGQTSA